MTTNFRRTFGDAASPLPLSYLDENFNQLENTSTSTVTLAGAGLVGYIASGSGATAGDVQTELRYFVRPEQFGAVGDGATDDSAAFHAAINSFTSGQAGCLLLADKTYKVNLVLSGLTNDWGALMIVGEGRYTILSAFDATLPVIKGIWTSGTIKRNLRCANFMVLGSGTNTAGHGFQFEYLHDSVFDRIFVQNVGGDCWNLTTCIGNLWLYPRVTTPNRDGIRCLDVECNANVIVGGRWSGNGGSTIGLNLAGGVWSTHGTTIESWNVAVKLGEAANARGCTFIGTWTESNLLADFYIGANTACEAITIIGGQLAGASTCDHAIRIGSGGVSGLTVNGLKSLAHTSNFFDQATDGGAISNIDIGQQCEIEDTTHYNVAAAYAFQVEYAANTGSVVRLSSTDTSIAGAGERLGKVEFWSADASGSGPFVWASIDVQSSAAFDGTSTNGADLILKAGSYAAKDTEVARATARKSFSIGTGAVATNAADGFLYVTACAGTPTGTPTTITGRVPIVVDSTNNKLYFYSGGAWRDAGP